MADDHQFLFGIEIGGTKLQIAAQAAAGHAGTKIIQRHRLTVDLARGADGIRRQIEATLEQMLRALKPAAVGVGFGGPVDWKTGMICRSHQIEGWSGFDLAGWLENLVHAPVLVDNDANMAALGEAVHGAGIGANPVFYITLGSGVGGGLVVDGDIYHGATPGEAEIGHVRLDRSGATVESRCAGWAVDARIREVNDRQPQSVLAALAGKEARGEARHLGSALQQSDETAQKVMNELTEDLAFGLSHAVHL